MEKFYDFSAMNLRGNKEISMSDYAGKVVVVVNTASKCGFTPQLEGLETMLPRKASRERSSARTANRHR